MFMKLKEVDYTFAGLIMSCPHCYMWAFPSTIEVHMEKFSDLEIKEMYVSFSQEIKDYVAECKADKTTQISAYGQDLARLFRAAKSEMIKRKLS
jgi:hypothetical protein